MIKQNMNKLILGKVLLDFLFVLALIMAFMKKDWAWWVLWGAVGAFQIYYDMAYWTCVHCNKSLGYSIFIKKCKNCGKPLR